MSHFSRQHSTQNLLSSAQHAANTLCQQTRVGPNTIKIEKPAEALERYRSDYSSSMVAAEAAAAHVASLSSSIAAAREAMSEFAVGSPAWKAAKDRADKALREMQSAHATSTSGILYQSDLDGTRDRERQAADAEWRAASKAFAEMEATGAAATASGSPLNILYQELQAATPAEAKHRTDAAAAAAAIKTFEDLRAAEAAAEQKRLDEIARLLAQADKDAADDALRREKISALAATLSVGYDVAESVLKHLQSLRYPVRPTTQPTLSVLQAINRFATQMGIRFQDAETMLSN